MSPILFYALAAVAVAGGISTVTRRHPLAAAMSLVVSFVALAGLYAMLAARLLAMLQVLVYAGAIMALVVFVIMLLNVRRQDLENGEPVGLHTLFALVVAAPMFYLVVLGIKQLPVRPFPSVPAGYGGIHDLGIALFTHYAFPFEAISLLLLAALIGVVVLAKRRFS